MPAERSAEGARRAVTDSFGDFGKPDVAPAEQILSRGSPTSLTRCGAPRRMRLASSDFQRVPTRLRWRWLSPRSGRRGPVPE